MQYAKKKKNTQNNHNKNVRLKTKITAKIRKGKEDNKL